MTKSPPAIDPSDYDPTFLHARREAWLIFLLWVAVLLWSVPYCYFHGYGRSIAPEELETVLGVPRWLFYGIFVPWLAADLFTIWFCFWYMQDDPLGEEAPHAATAPEDA